MAEEKMVDLDTSGEGQEVELPQEESTENKEVEKKVIQIKQKSKKKQLVENKQNPLFL